MGNYYSPMTGMNYSSKEQRDAMEKKYMADLEKQKIKEIQKINERTRNGGLTDSEILANGWIQYGMSGGRIASLYLALSLIIGSVLLISNMTKISISLYIIASGFVIEAISSYREKIKKKKNNKNKKNNKIYEFILLVIGILIIIVTLLPISTLKTFLPIANSNSYILNRSNYDYSSNIDLGHILIDGEDRYYEKDIELDINKQITIEVEYYYKEDVKTKHTKTIKFNPKEYFNNLEKNNIDSLPSFYEINVLDLI